MLRTISKLKKLIFCSLIGLIIVLANTQAHAIDCAIASVIRVGPSMNTATDDKVLVYLKNNTAAAVGTWLPNSVRAFYLHPAIANKGLATLLTAFTTEKMVYVRVANTNAAALSSIILVNIR